MRSGRIRQLAAVRGNDGENLRFAGGDLAAALTRLDALADGCAFLLGHNFLHFDRPHLTAAEPRLRLLALPVIDTLWLNPLAFPRHPYHRLVKHYQDGGLKRGQLNDPLLDAQLTLDLFHDQYRALHQRQREAPELMLAWHWLTTLDQRLSGINSLFATLRRQLRPSDGEARAAIARLLADKGCPEHARQMVDDAAHGNWSLAYALAWLSVAGGNSVLPPWVRHQFPDTALLLRRLRDLSCRRTDCPWCSEYHDADRELARHFGFAAFRPEPADADGQPLQRKIVEAALAGQHLLAILPTGTGKSLCYQIPALSRFAKTGALTMVISPLVALMADQVAGLRARGIECCVAINGLLSLPERADALDRVRLGDAGIVIVSPEQLRNPTLRKVLAQREIGAWVLDEAHCLSKWGHDFRPDYRYVGRFIREKAGDGPLPPVMCLTATAKPDVVADIVAHFAEKVGVDLCCFDGGASRSNLDFSVLPTTPAEKLAHIHELLTAELRADAPGGAIVYCSTRGNTEEVSAFLAQKGLAAAHFHAGLPPESRKNVQQAFIAGELRVIAATNAFGMGIDKPDVRLVIHADIPGSLENYLQEAGRAGRDQQAARCVLLYAPEDVERQFGMSARSRLTRKEIQAILRSLRQLDRKKRGDGEVIATAGEILAEDEDGGFARDSATDDTRVRTAVCWLEEAHLLRREENRVQVFPSSLRVGSVEQARQRLARAALQGDYQRQLLALVEALIGAAADEGLSTDELMVVSGLSPENLRKALYDLERLGIASNDTALTAYLRAGVEDSSTQRLERAARLEVSLIELLREQAPDLERGESSLLHLRLLAQRLHDDGHASALPERLRRLLAGLAGDGRNDEGGIGSIALRRVDAETVAITLQRDWANLVKTAQLRRTAGGHLLAHLLACLPSGARGADQLAETTLGRLLAALEADLLLKSEVRETSRLLDRALLWLHEQEAIRLNKGLAVFRPAMTIRLDADWKRQFRQPDFAPLKLHYEEQVLQIHVMAEYVLRGLQTMAEALRLTLDYFHLPRDQFLQRWLPEREGELARQTTPDSWRRIVEALANPVQQGIVADDRENANVLVLAGPGSGKTRVLVHRIAYLLRVRRENPRGILALAYNRHAAAQIRQRLGELIGDDARGVGVLTCDALAMRLVGASFVGRERLADEGFEAELHAIRQRAIDLLKGDARSPEQADADAERLRDRVLAGFRWILVDEYQDIGPQQYELIGALAGRSRSDEESRLNLFAVGDDDQNIYAFNGASVEFIRRFESDYAARTVPLVDNYRATAHLIDVANRLIAPAANRMKAAHPIRIDRARRREPAGGAWAKLDPVASGRVQILPAGSDARTQAIAVLGELQRLAGLAPAWDWARCAVIAREWKWLQPLRSLCEVRGIPVQMANEESAQFWRQRDTQLLLAWLHEEAQSLLDARTIAAWLARQADSPQRQMLAEAVDEYGRETGNSELPRRHFIEWLAEWGREARRRQCGLLLLTAHRAKGLEFDHVAVLDGAWRAGSETANEDPDAERRLYYVALTRARQTLLLARFARGQQFLDQLPASPSLLRRSAIPLPPPAPELSWYYRQLHPGEVDLSFAGRHPPTHPIQQAIAALTPSATLHLRHEHRHWLLRDDGENVVGRLAAAYTPPAGMHCIAARVGAILVRRREDSEPEYRAGIRCERWEVVLPELVFAPASDHDPCRTG
ncbi:MAG TPA: RecQ family ATP-dependent DNA helicase [Accumulibacter sp.]|uniref:RecQ family ATP-dependent DNA helicase n=1 Tax=Accumulibacter sp. TaxID=2053492 RepID=UPI0025DBC504|nr:RecQ family ATP-dependent DNA helicase [Accumulibacter sp.]MCM8599697.1 RecQ family ATP-dependent DNA helicase [Accumulibacter sp.]MCM8664380.1 RecQ family ATP-dependent DNA helicase [Accumulibacter sp.]HNC51597.1 RecQ family ATP-dependent DNA helicase [Accumulibacter sp.]